MAYNFEGKNILVTGAGRNIGRSIATALAKQGAKVYALDCVKENLDSLVEEIENIVPVLQDLRDWEATAKTVDELGTIDGLVNCAGIGYPPQNAVDVPKERLDKCIKVNLNAPINLMQVVGKKMIACESGGSMVNIGSLFSMGAANGYLPYGVAKAGLVMATKMFALELGPHNIRVNCVSPGGVLTDMFMTFAASDSEERVQAVVSKTPLGRLSKMQDVADLVAFLLSDHSLMISGTNYVVDGGLSCQVPN